MPPLLPPFPPPSAGVSSVCIHANVADRVAVLTRLILVSMIYLASAIHKGSGMTCLITMFQSNTPIDTIEM